MFEIGDKVEIITPATELYNGKIILERKRFAYVRGYEVSDWNGAIVLLLFKPKKDNTPSRIHDYVRSGSGEIVKQIV